MEEIKTLVEGLNKGITAIKSEVESVKNRDGLAEEKLSKMAESITQQAEALQAIEAKQKAFEAAAARIDVAGKSGASEIEKKHSEAFNAYLKGDSDALRSIGIKSGAEGIEVKGLATNNQATGGYLVLPERAQFIADRVFESSPLRQLARVVQTASDRIEVLVDDDEAAASWGSQGATVSESDTPDLGLLTIPVHKLVSYPKATNEMLADAYMDAEAWLATKVGDSQARAEATAFFSGNNVSRPQGLLTLSAWASAGVYERNKLEQVNLGGASTLTADGLIGLQGSLKELYQSRATFLMNRTTFAAAMKLKGNDNFYFGMELLKNGQQQLQLLGKPVVFCSDMPVVAANALSLAYGDFGVGYTIVDKVGFMVKRDDITSPDFVKFYFARRVGGAVTNFDAIKIGKVAA